MPGNLILLSNAEAGLLMNKLVQNSAGLGGMSTLANPAGRSMQEQTHNYLHHFNLYEQDEVVKQIR